MTRRRNWRRRQRGSELVECSMIAVALFGFTFLLLDVSMIIFLRSTFQHAVREGVRYGITGAINTGPCQDDSIKAVVKRNAIGFLNSPTGAATIHVRFMNPVDGTQTDNSPGNIIQVSVEAYKYGPLAPYQRVGAPMIWARAFDIVEPFPGANPCLTKSE